MFEGQKTNEPKPIGHGQPKHIANFLLNLDGFYKNQESLTETDKTNLKQQFKNLKKTDKRISINKLAVPNEHKHFLKTIYEN